METKICTECGEEKELDTNFAFEGKGSRFRRNKCKSCVRKWNALPKEERDRIKTEQLTAIQFRVEKTCPTCKITKLRSQFYISRSHLDGLSAECKECDDERTSILRKRNRQLRITGHVVLPEHLTCRQCKEEKPINLFTKNSTYKVGYDTLCKQCRRTHWKGAITQEKRIRDLLHRIRVKCNKHNIPFDLSVEDILIPDVCPVLGLQLKFGNDRIFNGTGATDDSPSIDRIYPDKGYVRGNVIIVSWRANKIKSNASIGELIRLAAFYKKLTT